MPLTNRPGVKVDCLGIVFRLERLVALLLHLLRGERYRLFGQRFWGSNIQIIDFAIRLI